MFQPLGGPLARGLVRQREKHNLRARITNQLPTKGTNRRLQLALAQRQLRVQLLQRNAVSRSVVGHAPQKERFGPCQPRMRQQQPRQLSARISSNPGHSRAHRRLRLLAARLRRHFEFLA